jgi:hypothetical protein
LNFIIIFSYETPHGLWGKYEKRGWVGHFTNEMLIGIGITRPFAFCRAPPPTFGRGEIELNMVPCKCTTKHECFTYVKVQSQNLLQMQLRVNFHEGLLYHQETLNFEYPTHLTNYYPPTYLDLWATMRGEICAPLLMVVGAILYWLHYQLWPNIILALLLMSEEIEVHNCILISKTLVPKNL